MGAAWYCSTGGARGASHVVYAGFNSPAEKGMWARWLAVAMRSFSPAYFAGPGLHRDSSFLTEGYRHFFNFGHNSGSEPYFALRQMKTGISRSSA